MVNNGRFKIDLQTHLAPTSPSGIQHYEFTKNKIAREMTSQAEISVSRLLNSLKALKFHKPSSNTEFSYI